METEIRTILVDDEQGAIDVFKELLTNVPEIKIVATANSVDKAINEIAKHKPELVFLDVEMPNKDGFDLLHEIRDFKTKPTIIFVTAYNEYAIEALRHAAFDYLLKPVSSVDLQKAVERFKQSRQTKTGNEKISLLLDHINPKKIKFNTRSGSFFIIADEVLYVKADGNYSEIFLTDGSNKTVCMYLNEVHEQLSREQFKRLGRSVLINLNYLSSIDRKSGICTLKYNNENFEIKVSSKYLKEL